MHPTDKPHCFNNHMGLWLCDDGWLAQATRMITAGTWKAENTGTPPEADNEMVVSDDGIAIISIAGPIMKARSKFGGTSSVYTRKLLRQANADDRVKAILLVVDSPGGHVAGTKDLADEVRNSEKPVYAQVDDLAASAALWVASQAREVFANATAEVGSIGVYAVVYDTSEAYERDGVKVHVISTGENKGAMVDGLPIKKQSLKALQERVDDINIFFMEAVMDGRDMSQDDVADLADGSTWIASKAQELGLIDGVQSFSDTLTMIRGNLRQKAGGRRKNIRAQLAIAAAETATVQMPKLQHHSKKGNSHV